MMNLLRVTLAALLVNASALWAADIGTAFTYQGVLENPPGNPLNDTCAFEFALCDDAVAACSPGTVSSHAGVAVTSGLFTVPDVDFGDNACNGEARWMEISVKCSGDASFVTLSPRVELKPAPYAFRAVEGVGPPTGIHVTPDGDVGIGTNSPQVRLDVIGAARTTTMEVAGGLHLGFPVAGWGDNSNEQVTMPREDHSYTIIAAGATHSLAIRDNGTLAGWGNNGSGQISVPPGTFVSLASGEEFGLAIRSDGSLVGWGRNDFGQTETPPGTFVAVAAGDKWGVAIRSDGTLVGWGHNNYGQTAVPVGTFTAVSAGHEFGLGLRTDGTLVAWGSNSNGQVDVPLGAFVAIAAGGYHAIAIRNNGTLAGWGLNSNGQADVPNGTFETVAAGRTHSLGIRTDGSLIGWGDNGSGQIDVPEGTFSEVAAGTNHSLAVRIDQTSQFGLLLATDSAAKPGTNTWTIWSDRRLKKEIEPLGGALERLTQLHGRTFRWRDPATQGGDTRTQMGLIADEVQRVFPQWVGRDPKGYQTLTVGGFEALTAEALRELREEKDCEIEDLKSQILDLKEMVHTLSEKQKGRE